nr:hypothetical protein BaRGS_015270 [Batillaria attramentaria]
MTHPTTAVPNITEVPAEPEVWEYPPEVVVVATVVMSVVVAVALLLNTVLVMTIQFSPSLKTPPNSHLLNICLNNLLLALHVLLALPSLHLSGVDVPRKGTASELELSGSQAEHVRYKATSGGHVEHRKHHFPEDHGKQVPGTLSHIAPSHRVVALLICRLLFFLNAPVYPLWYLLFSLRVKKCLARMCETLLVRFQYRQ